LAQADERTDAAALALGHFTLGFALGRLGDLDAARQSLVESKVLFEQAGDRRGAALARQFAAVYALGQGSYDAGRTELLLSNAVLREVGDDYFLANGLFLLGEVTAPSDPASARLLYEESLTIFRAIGDPWGIAWPLAGLGGLALREGDYPHAHALFEEALALRRSIEAHWGVAIALTSLAEVERRTGEYVRAAERLFEALELFRESGDVERIAWVRQCLAFLAIDQDDGTAATHLREAFTLRRRQGHLPGLALVLDGMATVTARSSTPNAAHDARTLFAIADRLRSAAGTAAVSEEPAVAAARRDVGIQVAEPDQADLTVDQILTTAEQRFLATLAQASARSA
jgi:tetratricopeptide (TPR) repeat protein